MSVEFFRFVRGADVWRYASLSETVTAGSETWLPAPIRRADVEVSTEMEKSGVSLSAMRDLAPIALYFSTTPRAPTYVTIYRADASSLSTFAAFWHGQISSVQWQGSTAEIRCEPVLALMRRTSPRQRYSTSCRWALYDSGCGVNRNATANFRTGSIIETSSPTRIKIATTQVADDIENWARGGTIEVTSIADVSPETVTLSEATVIVSGLRHRWIELARPLESYAVGDTIRLQRGCGHRLEDCTAFGNAPRYGGFPYLPAELAP